MAERLRQAAARGRSKRVNELEIVCYNDGIRQYGSTGGACGSLMPI
ncbi:hypothetical protein ACF3MZ_30480 [Paenibacillaceae bacterium WGS1546]